MRRKFKDDITGLDIGAGIAHYGYCEDSYYAVLESFVKNTRLQLDDIKRVSINDLSTYAVIIHGIKGASRGISAYGVDVKADELENAARAGDHEFVLANYLKFHDILVKLLDDIETALAKIGNKQKPVKSKPEKELLVELLDACKNIDIDEIDTAMEKLESSEYTSDDGLTVWLRESLDRGAFKEIREKLNNVLLTEV